MTRILINFLTSRPNSFSGNFSNPVINGAGSIELLAIIFGEVTIIVLSCVLLLSSVCIRTFEHVCYDDWG